MADYTPKQLQDLNPAENLSLDNLIPIGQGDRDLRKASLTQLVQELNIGNNTAPKPIHVNDADIFDDGIYSPIEEGEYTFLTPPLIYDKSEGITFFYKVNDSWLKNVTPVNFTPTGNVVIGDPDAVSGDKTRKAIDAEVYKVINSKLEIGGINLTTGDLVTSNTRVRTVNFETSGGKIILTSPNLFITNVLYFNNGVRQSRVDLAFVTQYDIAYPAGSNQFKVVLSKNPNTTVIIQSDVDNTIMEIHANEKYDFQAIDTFKPMQSDYDNAEIDINTSDNELGGIVNTTGANSDNNIRIRSKSFVEVVSGETYKIQNVTPGYVLSRIFRYLNGVFVSNTQYPPDTFTPNSTFNQIRLVWEKTINTEEITQAEVDAFSFNIFSISGGKITEMANRVSSIPNIEYRLSDLESLKGNVLSILGDSISTFTGYIPSGNLTYYPNGDVTSVTQTWWYQLLQKSGMTLAVNNSWSGSAISGTGASAFTSRVGNIGNPDICLVFGGANDYRQSYPIGDWNFSNTTFDRTVFKQSVQKLIYDLLTAYPLVRFVFLLPTYRNDQGDNRVNGFPVNWNQEKYLSDYQDAIIEACNTYGVEYIDMRGLWSYYNVASYTIDSLHPNQLGMSKMADYILSKLK